MGAVLGGPWAVLGASWAILDGSWAVLGAKLGPSWSPRPFKIDPKIDCEIKNGTGLAPKLNEKSMLILKGGFSKKHIKTNEKTRFLRFRVVEIGQKIHPKIYQK